MPDAAAILRRQIAEHERAAQELRQLLAEITSSSESNSASVLNGAASSSAVPAANGTAIDIETICRANDIAISPDGFITEPGLAAIVRKSEYTVRNWRNISRPIPYRKIGRRVEYRLQDVAAFLASGAIEEE